jgi:hypothetical protein
MYRWNLTSEIKLTLVTCRPPIVCGVLFVKGGPG